MAGVRAMHAATDGNPDILDTSGVELMKDLCEVWSTNAASDIMEWLVCYCLQRCVMGYHERCCAMGIIDGVVLWGIMDGVVVWGIMDVVVV